jgi:hypothetical protein
MHALNPHFLLVYLFRKVLRSAGIYTSAFTGVLGYTHRGRLDRLDSRACKAHPGVAGLGRGNHRPRARGPHRGAYRRPGGAGAKGTSTVEPRASADRSHPNSARPHGSHRSILGRVPASSPAVSRLLIGPSMVVAQRSQRMVMSRIGQFPSGDRAQSTEISSRNRTVVSGRAAQRLHVNTSRRPIRQSHGAGQEPHRTQPTRLLTHRSIVRSSRRVAVSWGILGAERRRRHQPPGSGGAGGGRGGSTSRDSHSTRNRNVRCPRAGRRRTISSPRSQCQGSHRSPRRTSLGPRSP